MLSPISDYRKWLLRLLAPIPGDLGETTLRDRGWNAAGFRLN
jgi:hypothetical protein